MEFTFFNFLKYLLKPSGHEYNPLSILSKTGIEKNRLESLEEK